MAAKHGNIDSATPNLTEGDELTLKWLHPGLESLKWDPYPPFSVQVRWGNLWIRLNLQSGKSHGQHFWIETPLLTLPPTSLCPACCLHPGHAPAWGTKHCLPHHAGSWPDSACVLLARSPSPRGQDVQWETRSVNSSFSKEQRSFFFSFFFFKLTSF